MRQKTLQIEAYKIDVNQTSRDGAFQCPCCQAKISPNDQTETNYTINDIKLKGTDLAELVITCKRCLSVTHLCGFTKLYRTPAPKANMQNVASYINHNKTKFTY